MKSYRAVWLLGLYLCLSGQGAVAEGSWWDRGKSLFDDFMGSGAAASLTDGDIAAGLREALRVGTANVVRQLGQKDGYYADPRAHIPLPESLAQARDTLDRVGLGGSLDRLELRMNRAAEKAAPRARQMFVDAIAAMTLDDVRRIYNGPEDAATRYFQGQMSGPLRQEFTPVVEDSLAQVGAIRTWDKFMDDYRQIPLLPDIKANLSKHVVDHAIEAIFDYLAGEEAAIRKDPAKRTTDLLRRVFGNR